MNRTLVASYGTVIETLIVSRAMHHILVPLLLHLNSCQECQQYTSPSMARRVYPPPPNAATTTTILGMVALSYQMRGW